MRSESRSRIEYLIKTNNITVLDSYFNLANKPNLIDRLQYDFLFGSGLLFWATLYKGSSSEADSSSNRRWLITIRQIGPMSNGVTRNSGSPAESLPFLAKGLRAPSSASHPPVTFDLATHHAGGPTGTPDSCYIPDFLQCSQSATFVVGHLNRFCHCGP